MKKVIKLAILLGVSQLLTACMAAGPLIGAAVAPVLMNKAVTKASESKPPKYIALEKQGRIITASFDTKGFMIGMGQAAQQRGFSEWATAAVVRDASKFGCVNVINAFSAAGGIKANTTVGSSKLSNKLQFKCLEKETVMSETDLLADKLVIYSDQITYINQNSGMIVYK